MAQKSPLPKLPFKIAKVWRKFPIQPKICIDSTPIERKKGSYSEIYCIHAMHRYFNGNQPQTRSSTTHYTVCWCPALSKPIAERTKYQPRPSRIDMMKFSVFAFIAFTQAILHCFVFLSISLTLDFVIVAFPVARSDFSLDSTKQTVAMFDDCTRSNIQSPSLRIDAFFKYSVARLIAVVLFTQLLYATQHKFEFEFECLFRSHAQWPLHAPE